MSTSATAYVACDVSKATLQFGGPCPASTGKCPNQASAVRRELTRLHRLYPQLHLVCEPTGGYERLLLATAHVLKIPITRVDAWKVRHFALGLGWLEKSDPIDAELLRRYAVTAEVRPTPPGEATHERLRDWVQLREHYVKRLAEDQTFAQTLRDPTVQKRLQADCAKLEKKLEALDAEISEFLQKEAPALNDKVQTLCLVTSVGLRIATGILAYVPELGALSDGAIAKLVGVAPIVDDSGTRSGNKHIARGRAPARRILYQAALVAARHNEYLKPFYQRLRLAGKPAKVALIAVARKLLVYLNSLLRPAVHGPA